MRESEALGLTWDAIDFDAGTILVNKQLLKEKTKGGQYYLATLKNDKARRIKPAQSVMQTLKDHRQVQLEQRFKAGQAWDNKSNLVFTTELGGHLAHCTVYKNFKKIAANIGIPDSRFHDLRHSYAVAALSSGNDIKTVQENLGHATAAFTLNVYAHVSEKMKQDSADRMEAYIKNVQKFG